MKTIIFKNESDLPVLIGTWVETDIYGLSEFVETTVPGKKEEIFYEKATDKPENSKKFSLTGEWIVSSMFRRDDANYQIWKENGYEMIENIGKFRSQSCFSGNNVWTNTSRFQLYYIKNENTVLFVKNTIVV
jgi:hypothetical protein